MQRNANPLADQAPKERGDRATEQAYLELHGLTKSYQEGGQTRSVLKDVNLQLCQGESAAILGKSGSGKTTILNLISGIDQPDAGEIVLGGEWLSRMNEGQRTRFRRGRIGFIFQFFNLIPTLTVWENILLPLELNNRAGAEGKEHARRLLAEVELEGRQQAYPDRLSGGEQQRVAIARALVHDPLLVLADEPTGNLDEETGKHILALLDRLTRQTGKNLVMVTHSLEAASIAERIFFLRDGRLLEQKH